MIRFRPKFIDINEIPIEDWNKQDDDVTVLSNFCVGKQTNSNKQQLSTFYGLSYSQSY